MSSTTCSTPVDRVRSLMWEKGFHQAVWSGPVGDDIPELLMRYKESNDFLHARDFKIGSVFYMKWVHLESALEKARYPQFTVTAETPS